MRLLYALLLACALAGPALAEDIKGCVAFDTTMVPFEELKLQPFKDAKLPMAPERAPKDANSFAGFRNWPHVNPGPAAVVLSAEGWIDVVQNGRYLKPTSFSRVLDCPSQRKIVRFNLQAGPAILQLSGVAADRITVGFIAELK